MPTPVYAPVYAPDRAAYAAAVETLLNFLQGQAGTSGGRAAAQVLLSCYNGYDFHIDPGDIRMLARDAHRDAALTVIIQRVLLGIEPHELVSNGSRRFGVLWEKWEGLHVARRYKSHFRRKRK